MYKRQIETNHATTYEGDVITMDKIEDALERTKNLKATGQNGFNEELFKYADFLLQRILLHFYAMCWKRQQVPEDWLTARVM